MIIPDANLLLYMVNSNSPDHRAAFEWWKKLLDTDKPVGLCAVVTFTFIRLSTHHRVFPSPLTVREAFAYINNWLQFPSVTWLDTESEDLAVAEQLLTAAGAAGNLVTDAQIAAISLRLNATVHSADSDFSRFPGLRWKNPL